MQRLFAVIVMLVLGHSPVVSANAPKKGKEKTLPPALEITDVDVASQKPVAAGRISVFGFRLGDAKKDFAKRCAAACRWSKVDQTASREGVIYIFGEKGALTEIRLPMSFVENVLGETRRWFGDDFANDQSERIDALQGETAVKIKETSVMGKGFSETHTLVFGDTGIELSSLKVAEDKFSPQYLVLKALPSN